MGSSISLGRRLKCCTTEPKNALGLLPAILLSHFRRVPSRCPGYPKLLELEKPLAIESESVIHSDEQSRLGEPARPRIHLDYLDGLRALAALYVMVGHSRLQIWSDAPGSAPR